MAFIAAAFLAAVFLVVAACRPTPSPPSESDFVGGWCGAEGEVLTLDGDNSFTIDRLSERYANDFLHVDGYIEGYRLRTEFAGVVPASASGNWRLQLSGNDLLERYDHSLVLTFSALGDRSVNEHHQLFFEYDVADQIHLVVRRTTGYYVMFDRCPSPAPST